MEEEGHLPAPRRTTREVHVCPGNVGRTAESTTGSAADPSVAQSASVPTRGIAGRPDSLSDGCSVVALRPRDEESTEIEPLSCSNHRLVSFVDTQTENGDHGEGQDGAGCKRNRGRRRRRSLVSSCRLENADDGRGVQGGEKKSLFPLPGSSAGKVLHRLSTRSEGAVGVRTPQRSSSGRLASSLSPHVLEGSCGRRSRLGVRPTSLSPRFLGRRCTSGSRSPTPHVLSPTGWRHGFSARGKSYASRRQESSEHFALPPSRAASGSRSKFSYPFSRVGSELPSASRRRPDRRRATAFSASTVGKDEGSASDFYSRRLSEGSEGRYTGKRVRGCEVELVISRPQSGDLMADVFERRTTKGDRHGLFPTYLRLDTGGGDWRREKPDKLSVLFPGGGRRNKEGECRERDEYRMRFQHAG